MDSHVYSAIFSFEIVFFYLVPSYNQGVVENLTVYRIWSNENITNLTKFNSWKDLILEVFLNNFQKCREIINLNGKSRKSDKVEQDKSKECDKSRNYMARKNLRVSWLDLVFFFIYEQIVLNSCGGDEGVLNHLN